MAVHISRVMDFGRFSSRVDEVISMIKSLPPKWDSGIFMAGEIEYQLTEERLEKGIELEEAVISRLNTVVEKYEAEMLRV